MGMPFICLRSYTLDARQNCKVVMTGIVQNPLSRFHTLTRMIQSHAGQLLKFFEKVSFQCRSRGLIYSKHSPNTLHNLMIACWAESQEANGICGRLMLHVLLVLFRCCWCYCGCCYFLSCALTSASSPCQLPFQKFLLTCCIARLVF